MYITPSALQLIIARELCTGQGVSPAHLIVHAHSNADENIVMIM